MPTRSVRSRRRPSRRDVRLPRPPAAGVVPAASSRRSGPVVAASLALLGVLVYARGLDAPFVFDDRVTVVENRRIEHLWPPWVAASAPPRTPLSGRPLASLAMAVNYALGGRDVRGYRALNVALHVLAALILCAIVRDTLRRAPLAVRFGDDAGGVAAVIAAVWLVHPLQTEAVMYVTQRTELLMGLCCLATLLWALRDRPVASVTACTLGMLAKETAAVAPLLVVLYDRVFRFPSFAAAVRARWRLYAALAATWSVLAASLLLADRHESVGFGGGVTWWEYARTQAGVLVAYLRLALWPDALAVDHGVWIAHGTAEIVPAAVVVAALVVATAIALRRSRPVGFLGAWFLLTLAPTTSVVPITTETMAERRMYLPLAAVVALVVLGVHRVLRGSTARRLVAGGAVAVLAVASVRRVGIYASEEGLWRDAIQKVPGNARAHNNLGSLLLAREDLDGADAELARALVLDPRYGEARYNQGVVLLARGRFDDAATAFRDALALDPTLLGARYNLGTIALRDGRLEEAIAAYEEVLRQNPEHVPAATNLRIARAALAARSAP